jgi:hypothetical protein
MKEITKGLLLPAPNAQSGHRQARQIPANLKKTLSSFGKIKVVWESQKSLTEGMTPSRTTLSPQPPRVFASFTILKRKFTKDTLGDKDEDEIFRRVCLTADWRNKVACFMTTKDIFLHFL